jgi:hypothetical protein
MRRWLWRVAAGAAVVAVAVVLWVWSGRGTPKEAAETPLLRSSPADIVVIEVRKLEGASRLERTDAGWRLTGLVADHVDSSRVPQLLRSLALATMGPDIPGATPADGRFGFAEVDAVELLLTFRDGHTMQLGMGAQNPVTKLVYARGAGRDGVFVVTGPLRDLWTTVPDAVRLRRLLPPFARAEVDTVRIFARGSAQPLLIARADGGWWVREPASGLGTRVARYQQFYRDRRRVDAAGTWVLAEDRELSGLIYEVGETPVTGFAPAGAEAAVAQETGLEPPYRAVELVLASGARHRLELGEEQDDDVVWARRGTSVVATSAVALRTIEKPFADFADLGAFSFAFAHADSFNLDGLLAGRADPDSVGRWLPLGKPGTTLPIGPRVASSLLSDMQVALDGMSAVEVLPPSATDPLQAGERYTVTAWLSGGRRHDIALGRLRDGNLPAAWDPADGKVLLVSEEILISLRAVRTSLRGSSG